MIAIPLLTLVPGELGGSETYVRELLDGLADVGGQEYRVVVPPTAPDAGGRLPTRVATAYRRARSVPERLTAMALATARPGPLRTSLDGADAVHFPLTIELPRTSLPTAVTLHDVQHRDLPHLFSRAERAFRAFYWDRSARRADIVIAISEFVRERAVAQLGLDPSRVRVVPQGLDHDRFAPADVARELFLLYPARRWPHKNHDRLFDAFARVRRERPELRLVLTGGGEFGNVPDGVEARGQVPVDELVSLLRRASALVFPSLYEGFGLPPLEAMACGCPVACSNAAALPETVGNAALLFDPTDPSAIAAAIRDVLDDPRPWVARGLEHAAGFTWERTARATDAVYAELSSRV